MNKNRKLVINERNVFFLKKTDWKEEIGNFKGKKLETVMFAQYVLHFFFSWD